MYLLFTDGISNFGRDEPAPAGRAALHLLGRRRGQPRLPARPGHGQRRPLLQPGQLEGRRRSCPDRPRRPGRSFRPRSKAARRRTSIRSRPQPLAGRFTLVGKLDGEAATVTADYGIAGRKGPAAIADFQVSRADAAEGSLLRRLWAEKKLAELMIYQKQNEKEIAALGKQFGLVTPYTSLLVLDSLEQYVQYEIAPPKSLPAMREEYLRRIDTVEHQRQKQKADKLAEVLRMWEARVKWWNTEFKYPKDFKYKEEDGADRAADAALLLGMQRSTGGVTHLRRVAGAGADASRPPHRGRCRTPAAEAPAAEAACPRSEGSAEPAGRMPLRS